MAEVISDWASCASERATRRSSSIAAGTPSARSSACLARLSRPSAREAMYTEAASTDCDSTHCSSSRTMKGEKPHSDRRASAKYRFSHGPRATGSERCSASAISPSAASSSDWARSIASRRSSIPASSSRQPPITEPVNAAAVAAPSTPMSAGSLAAARAQKPRSRASARAKTRYSTSPRRACSSSELSRAVAAAGSSMSALPSSATTSGVEPAPSP
mmetsp:Transcript_40963/g.128668  ORF Transcript_40963/g.128668 Transcript_40963/m.128668 type:complete len:217 (-) Transcript_40963:711-1361(-)